MLITICRTNDGEDLLMTVSMPSIEAGTVGGGTVLGRQGSVLEMLGIKGPTLPFSRPEFPTPRLHYRYFHHGG